MVDANPGHESLQRELAVALNKIGDVRIALGEPAEALKSFEAAFALMSKIAMANPGNANLQRDLSTSINKVADALTLLGRRAEALANYRKSLLVVEALIKKTPQICSGSRMWHFRMPASACCLRLMDGAKKHLRRTDERPQSAKRLLRSNRRTSSWQRDYVTTLTRVGDLLLTMGRGTEALTSYRSALAAIEKLAATDPGNLQWQRDIAVIEGEIGIILADQGILKEALASYHRSLAISRSLLTGNPDNVQWLRHSSVIQNRVGDLLTREGRKEEALKAYQASLAIVEKLVAGNPMAEWQRDLAITLVKIGDVMVATDRAAARAYYERSLIIRERLAAAGPGNLGAQRDNGLHARPDRQCFRG